MVCYSCLCKCHITRSHHMITSHDIITWSHHMISSHDSIIWSHQMMPSHDHITWWRHMITPHDTVTWFYHMITSNDTVTWSHYMIPSVTWSHHTTVASGGKSREQYTIYWFSFFNSSDFSRNFSTFFKQLPTESLPIELLSYPGDLRGSGYVLLSDSY